MLQEKALMPAAKEKAGGADVYLGKGLVPALGGYIAELSGGGRVLVVRDDDGEALAANVAEALRGEGLRVTERRAEEAGSAEENCIVVLGVGGAFAADAAKAAAAERRGECVLFPSVPCEEGLLAGGGVKAVCLDEGVLAASPTEARAAACGILLASPVKRFEDLFAEKVLAERRDLRREELRAEDTAADIALKVIKSGVSGVRYACDVTAEMLRLIATAGGKRARRKGEYVFAAACALAAFYRAYLSSPATDTLIPADHSSAADEIARLAGGKRGNILQAFDIFGGSGYFRINYILGEYRMDLIAELASCDLTSAERKWRRMYEDAGFWMKSAFTSADMLRAMALAGELSGGLLGFAAGTGFLAAMTAGAGKSAKGERAARSG